MRFCAVRMGLLCLVAVMALFACLPAVAFGEATSTRPPAASAFVHPEASVPDVPECERVEDIHFERAVLVGDSLADGIAIHNVMPELQLLSRIGLSPRTALTNTTFKNNGKAVTVIQKLPVMRPDALYLWLGSNGLVSKSAGQVIRDYDRLLNRVIDVLPDTPIYLLEVTPVGTLTHDRYASFTNERIDDFNQQLREVAVRHNAYVLPINALLKDAEGLLDTQYAAEDNIHLLKPAYEVIAEYLYTHVLPAVETPPEAEE